MFNNFTSNKVLKIILRGSLYLYIIITDNYRYYSQQECWTFIEYSVVQRSRVDSQAKCPRPSLPTETFYTYHELEIELT